MVRNSYLHNFWLLELTAFFFITNTGSIFVNVPLVTKKEHIASVSRAQGYLVIKST